MIENSNEMRLRSFLKKLDYYRSEDYLHDLYFDSLFLKFGDRDYSIFIDYMMQGFNRKRHFLLDKYDVSSNALKSIAHKCKWSENARVWEKIVVDDFIKRMFPSSFLKQGSVSWSMLKGEGYFRYFCFLCYLFLNGGDEVFSQPMLARILSEGGVPVVSQSLKQFSARFGWLERCRQYCMVVGDSGYHGMMRVLERSCIGNLVESLDFVWMLLEKYDIDEGVYVEAFNDVVQATVEDCEERHVYGYGWVDYFDSVEFLEEILVYRVNVDPHDFVDIFDKYSDKSTSEIIELIVVHCDCFGVSVSDYSFYSSVFV